MSQKTVNKDNFENVDIHEEEEQHEEVEESGSEEGDGPEDESADVTEKLEEMVRRVKERAQELDKEAESQKPSMATSLVESKLLFTFNKIYFEFIKDVKRTKGSNSRVGQIIKKHYKCFDKLSPSSIQFVSESFSTILEVFQASAGVTCLAKDERLKDTLIFKDIKIGDIIPKEDATPEEAAKESDIISYYLYALYIFQHLYEEVDQDTTEQVHSLFVKAVEALTKGISMESLNEVMDDDLRYCLSQVSEIRARQPSLQHATAGPANGDEQPTMGTGAEGVNPLEFLENSRIGKLAKEISSQIDMGDLNIEKPEDLLSFDKLLSGKGQFGNILEKVGSAITNKIQSGEIQQEDLIQEAMQLMGKLNLGGEGGAGGLGGLGDMGGMMKDMLGMMGKTMGMGGSGGKKKSSVGASSGTRDRLRKKLEKKRK